MFHDCNNVFIIESTIRREIIAEVNINDLNFNLLIEEDLLWTGEMATLYSLRHLVEHVP